MTAALGEPVGAFKANAPANAEPTRGVIYAGTVFASPARIPAATCRNVVSRAKSHSCSVAICRRVGAPYSREEVAAAVDACAAIEVVTSRYQDPDKVSNLEKLADSISNGALVHAQPHANWRGLELGKLKVTLTVNGTPVLEQVGGHPRDDSARRCCDAGEHDAGRRSHGPVRHMGFVTGLRYLQPGDVCGVTFSGLGAASVTFVL